MLKFTANPCLLGCFLFQHCMQTALGKRFYTMLRESLNNTYLMEFSLGGTASAVGECFCFLVGTRGNLSSDFLFFSTTA